MATSTPQVVATATVYDYYLDSQGNALANKPVVVTLNYAFAQSISPLTSLQSLKVSTTTDRNGYWSVPLIPNANIQPANTLYLVQVDGQIEYQITVGSAGPYQSTAVGTIVNTPSALAAPSSIPGPLTITGALNIGGAARFAGSDPWFDITHPTYGADPTGVADSTAAVNAAIAQANLGAGGVIYWPPGVYRITAPLTQPANGKIIRHSGAGRFLDNTVQGVTFINYVPTTTGTTLFTFQTHACGLEHINIQQGNSQGTTNAVVIQGAFGCTLYDVMISAFTGTGLTLRSGLNASGVQASCIYNYFLNIGVRTCNLALSMAGSTTNGKSCNANTFLGCQFTTSTGTQNANLGDTVNENGFYTCDFSGGTTVTDMLVLGDGTGSHTTRGNCFWAVTAEGTGANTNGFTLQTGALSTLIEGDIIPQGTGVKINNTGGTTGWFWDDRTGLWSTLGATGFRFDTSGNLGLNAAPLATGINAPTGWSLMASGSTAAQMAGTPPTLLAWNGLRSNTSGLGLDAAPPGSTGINGAAGWILQAGGSTLASLPAAGFQIGTGGTPLAQVTTYAPNLTPSSVAANTTAEQTFAVTGLATNDKVVVNGPAPTAGTGIVGVRVSGANTLAITFVNATAGALTPAAGVYTVVAIRS